MGTNIKDIKEIKESIAKSSTKGFSYFIKNVGIILLLLLIVFVISNPSILINPNKFFSEFDITSLWSILLLFLSIGGVYQLAKSIAADNSEIEKATNIKDYTAIAKEVEEQILIDKENKHKELIQRRIDSTPLIHNELKNLLINLNADRAAIAEMHNGTNNLNGLPFLFFDVTYEEISPEVKYVSDDFRNFNMGKYPFISKHFSDGTFIGHVDEIEKEDPRLAATFKFADAYYGIGIVLHGIDGPLGFLTVTFKNDNDIPSKIKIIQEVDKAAQKLSTLLDKIYK